MSEEMTQNAAMSRRTTLRLGAAGGLGAALAGASVGAPYLSQKGLSGNRKNGIRAKRKPHRTRILQGAAR